jgi:predicted Zn-dependent peptidase
VLAYGNGSILEQELVQEGLASYASAHPYKTRYDSLFALHIQMAPGKSNDKALDVVNDGIKRLRNGKISAEELERAKNQYLLLSYGELLTQDGIGGNLGEALVSSDNYLRNLEILDQVKEVTVSDLQRVANAYLVEKNSSFVKMMPEKGKSR